MNSMWLALVLFIVMYVLLLKFSDFRWIIALVFAGIFMITGIVSPLNAINAINWNVIMMIAGTMATVELFIQSRMPARMAEGLLKIVPNVQWAVVALSLFAGVVSAFVDNVATVLMVAPVGLAVSKQLNTNPVPVIISIAVSSNLQGAATLVGDTTSILLGSYANMSFNDFFWFLGKPGICFAVEAGALATIPVLLYLFKEEKAPVDSKVTTVVTDHVPTVLLFGTILALIIASQFENKPELTNGIICVVIAIIGIIYECHRQKNNKPLTSVIKAMDYQTLLLLAGLFMVIEGITEAGVIDAIANVFVKIGGNSVLFMYILIVAVSVALSAFIDNIPYVATMLPVITGITNMLGISPYLLYFGLLTGATLGGNITPIGASANIAATGILKKEGYEVTFGDFAKIGIPFTLAAVTAGYLYIWFVFKGV